MQYEIGQKSFKCVRFSSKSSKNSDGNMTSKAGSESDGIGKVCVCFFVCLFVFRGKT